MSIPENPPDDSGKSSRQLPPGTMLGDFKILRYLDSGSMGTVYVAEQTSLSREVALKIFSRALAPEPESKEQFLKEIRLTAALDHPNIVTAFGAGQEGDYIYLAMKFIDARDLADLLQEYPRIDEGDTLKIGEAIAEALLYAWDEKKLIHRDIKPGNIKLSSSTKPHLLDLGISITAEQECALAAAGYVVGTPDYMAPEQCLGKSDVDFRTDVYSLGATLYHMVTGSPPFSAASPQDLLKAQIHDELEPPTVRNPKVSNAMSELIEWMMRKKPEDRPASWPETVEAIRKVRAEFHQSPAEKAASDSYPTPPADVQKPSQDEPKPAPTSSKMGPAQVVAAIIIVLLVLGLAVVLTTCSESPADPPAPDSVVATPNKRGPQPAPARTDGTSALLAAPHDTPQELHNLRASLEDVFNSKTAGAKDKRDAGVALETLRRQAEESEAIVSRLWDRAITLLEAAGPEQAIGLIQRYDGPSKNWVIARRPALITELKTLAKKSPKERKKDESQAEQHLRQLAAAIASGNFNIARKIYREAELSPSSKTVKELRSAKVFVSIDLIIAESFRSQIGTTVSLELNSGPRTVTISGIKDGTVHLAEIGKKGKSITSKLDWQKLAASEWKSRLANRTAAEERYQILRLGTQERSEAKTTLESTQRPFLIRVARHRLKK